jgi:phosphoribosyl-ATP pyrophosphohydrolase/phosphoribosyl-AMP cyclohydrolase
VLARVTPAGPACHTGEPSCFGADALSADALAQLDAIIARRATETEETASYTRKLLGDRNLRLKKIGEEAAELVTACADGDAERAREEAADLLYHSLVALHAAGGSLRDVQRILAERHGGPRRS